MTRYHEIVRVAERVFGVDDAAAAIRKISDHHYGETNVTALDGGEQAALLAVIEQLDEWYSRPPRQPAHLSARIAKGAALLDGRNVPPPTTYRPSDSPRVIPSGANVSDAIAKAEEIPDDVTVDEPPEPPRVELRNFDTADTDSHGAIALGINISPNGSGILVSDEITCPACHGKGTLPVSFGVSIGVNP